MRGVLEAAGHAAWQVDLADIPGDHRFGAEANARQEHFHLFGRGVLRFVEDDEGMVERAPPHERQRRDFQQTTLKRFGDPVKAHQIVERVVERAQVRVDFLRQIPRQEAQALAGFHRWARQDDALHAAALQRIHGAGHS